MQRRWVVGFVVGAVVAAAVVVSGGAPAGAAGPTVVGGQQVAPFAGNFAPAASSNGSQTLVVYQVPTGSSYEIYGRLLSPDTSTIGQPFIIGDNQFSHSKPDVAWNGSAWLVVYQEKLATIDYDVIGQRVSTAGGMVGGPIRIGSTGGKELNPAVAAGANGQWAVTFDSTVAEGSYGRDVMVGRVSKAGVALDYPVGLRASADTPSDKYQDVEPDIAWDGSHYMVAWEASGAQRRMYLAGMRSNGDLLCRCAFSFAGPGGTVGSAAIASDGDRFLIVYDENGAGTSDGVDIAGFEVDLADSGAYNATYKAISRQPGSEQEPDVAWNGSYLVAWRDRRDNYYGDLYGARVKPGLQVVDPDGFLISEYHQSNSEPALTKGAAAHRFAVAWQATPAGGSTGVLAYGLNFPAPK